ncbi:MAG: hypothetical protein IJW13_00130 [Clostridia bacterium]|nr:hypothetical protein [Clostridia bacterium]
MIHSLAGGKLKDNGYYTVIKVKFINNPLALARPYFYLCEVAQIEQGEVVLAPYGKNQTEYEAEVIRVDKCVSEQTLPMPLSKMATVTKRK